MQVGVARSVEDGWHCGQAALLVPGRGGSLQTLFLVITILKLLFLLLLLFIYMLSLSWQVLGCVKMVNAAAADDMKDTDNVS